MKIYRKPRKKARIEIVPMIDTMFFLLVFFMMATLEMTMQSGIPVNLPSAEGSRSTVQEIVTLTLTRDGKIFFDKTAIQSKKDVAVRLQQEKAVGKDITVIIQADDKAEHGQVVGLMDAVRQAGINKLSIAVQPLNERLEQ